ncbi:MAG: helix-turn-helix transcriptional regulator [Gemmatimonadetes bacterium]|nr:helix-turn-helix transcriptional regulator [Gemmatimonadota bacterium]
MHILTAKDLGHVIRERRKHLGLDQGVLAKRAGVSRQWVVEIERGKARAEVGLVLRVLGVLGVDLLARSEPSPPSPAASPSALIDIDAIVERGRDR